MKRREQRYCRADGIKCIKLCGPISGALGRRGVSFAAHATDPQPLDHMSYDNVFSHFSLPDMYRGRATPHPPPRQPPLIHGPAPPYSIPRGVCNVGHYLQPSQRPTIPTQYSLRAQSEPGCRVTWHFSQDSRGRDHLHHGKHLPVPAVTYSILNESKRGGR
jgi:hypothetical protein